MNDFTKEELCTLFKCIRLAEIDHGECSDLDNIKFKIQSMIDSYMVNYCEHDYKKTLDKSGMWFINMCHKCKDSKPWRVLDDNQ